MHFQASLAYWLNCWLSPWNLHLASGSATSPCPTVHTFPQEAASLCWPSCCCPLWGEWPCVAGAEPASRPPVHMESASTGAQALTSFDLAALCKLRLSLRASEGVGILVRRGACKVSGKNAALKTRAQSWSSGQHSLLWHPQVSRTAKEGKRHLDRQNRRPQADSCICGTSPHPLHCAPGASCVKGYRYEVMW